MDEHPLRSALSSAGRPDLVEVLADGLAGSELTTVLLEAMRRRAASLSPADVLRRYEADRFTAPAVVTLEQVRAAEDRLLQSLPVTFDRVQLSPLVPLGAHSTLAGVAQNNVVTTVRGTEVAADPTNGLALEAAQRRRRLLSAGTRSAQVVRLATVQRVVRAQRFEGDHSFTHFGVFAAVTAGRDTGNRRFEIAAVTEHLDVMLRALDATGAGRVVVELTDFTAGDWKPVVEAVSAGLADRESVETTASPPDAPGGTYYAGLRFQIYARHGDEMLHCGDGGLVDWTRRLLSDRKERMVISGIGVDRYSLLLR